MELAEAVEKPTNGCLLCFLLNFIESLLVVLGESFLQSVSIYRFRYDCHHPSIVAPLDGFIRFE